jgi:hypothetical protein
VDATVSGRSWARATSCRTTAKRASVGISCSNNPPRGRQRGFSARVPHIDRAVDSASLTSACRHGPDRPGCRARARETWRRCRRQRRWPDRRSRDRRPRPRSRRERPRTSCGGRLTVLACRSEQPRAQLGINEARGGGVRAVMRAQVRGDVWSRGAAESLTPCPDRPLQVRRVLSRSRRRPTWTRLTRAPM